MGAGVCEERDIFAMHISWQIVGDLDTFERSGIAERSQIVAFPFERNALRTDGGAKQHVTPPTARTHPPRSPGR